MKKCKQCKEGVLKSARENYLYVESGLPNVVLQGVEVRRCPKCGAHEVVIPRVTELFRVLALAVVRKAMRLTGAEIKYLRKSMGWSGADFALHMDVDPATVSRWENDKDRMSSQADRLLRLMVVRDRPVEEYPVDALTEIGEGYDSKQIGLRPTGHGWDLAA